MYKEVKLGGIKTSKTELIDIAKSWLVISLAFTFVYSGIGLFGESLSQMFSLNFLVLFAISLFTAGIGFLLHELGHKFVAQHYGCMAEFRAYDQMLYLALILSVLVGMIFAAPGAVMISGMITRRENGIISIAGPLVNYSLAMIFLGLRFLFPAVSIVSTIAVMGFTINLWLGLFNMIPFGNFDGKKIYEWNLQAWLGMVIFGVFFLFSGLF